ncbi:MAG: hypothetical protein KF795_14460 [Labilithrix sp.]|nr:hypothetical protein [Labilithrix sp.]
MTPLDRHTDADASANASPDDDPLLRALRALPVHPDPTPRHASAAARAAFVRAFDDAPWYARAFGAAGRATVPVVLASVVGLYLFWAFATAIALNQ